MSFIGSWIIRCLNEMNYEESAEFYFDRSVSHTLILSSLEQTLLNRKKHDKPHLYPCNKVGKSIPKSNCSNNGGSLSLGERARNEMAAGRKSIAKERERESKRENYRDRSCCYSGRIIRWESGNKRPNLVMCALYRRIRLSFVVLCGYGEVELDSSFPEKWFRSKWR